MHETTCIPYTSVMNRPRQSLLNSPKATVLAAVFCVASSLAAESVAVRVETQKGKPVEGATVSVRDSEDGTVLDSAVTSDEGVAIIQQLTPGEWYFEIDRPGFMLYTAYVQVREGKKPDLGFASQVSRGDDWDPLRVKFVKATDRLQRKAVIATPPEPRVREPVRVEEAEEPVRTKEPVRVEEPIRAEEPVRDEEPARVEREPEPEPSSETRPEQMPAPEDSQRRQPPEPAAGTVAVPSTVEDVEPETVTAGDETPPDLSVADGEPEPLAEQPGDEPPAMETEEADEPAETPQEETLEEDVQLQQDALEAESESQPEPAPPTPSSPAAPTEVDAQTSPPEASPEVTPEPGPGTSPTPDESAVTTPSPAPTEAPDAVDETTGRTVAPTAARDLRSAAAGTCPECEPGEWAVSAAVQAATAGDTRSTSTCATDLNDRVRAFAEQLTDRPQEPFAGPFISALWRTPDDADRAAMAETAADFNSPQGYCQVAGVVLPAGSAMTGYVFEAWDDLGGRACNGNGICALPKAGWSGPPVVVRGEHATIVYSIFRNRSTRHQRSAELTVLFAPPPEWQ